MDLQTNIAWTRAVQMCPTIGTSSGADMKEQPLRILITGAVGMLGSAVCRTLHRHSYEVWGMLHRCQPKWPYTSFVTADLTDFASLSQVFQQVQPDWVIHTASWADVRPAPRPADTALAGERYFQTTGHRMPNWKDGLKSYLNRIAEGNDAT